MTGVYDTHRPCTRTVYASPLFWKNAVANTTDFASGGSRLWVAHWTKGAKPLVPAKELGRARLDVVAVDRLLGSSPASRTARTATG